MWVQTMDISGIDYLGIDRVIKRGSGVIIIQTEKALLVKDTVSEAYMLACEETEIAMALFDRYLKEDCRLLMTSDNEIGKAVFKKYGFLEKLECYQVAYYEEKPVINCELSFKTAEKNDLDILIKNYDLISPQELEKVVKRKSIVLAYEKDHLVGFMGEHLEGSMGLLYVFPKYRKKGFGMALQTYFIRKTMEKGYVPFGQVEKENQKSLHLQKKIGMTKSEKLIMWMWK